MARSRKTGELVRTWPGGFPGPAAHAIIYQRLKERAFEQVPHDFGISGSRTASMDARRRRGRPVGRPKALAGSQVEQVRKLFAAGESAAEIAKSFRVGRDTVYRVIKAAEEDPAG